HAILTAPAAPCRQRWRHYCPKPTTSPKQRAVPKPTWLKPSPAPVICKWARAMGPCTISTRFGAEQIGYSRKIRLDLKKTMDATVLSDLEQARFNMVEQQIRPWDVHDDEV